MLIKGASRGVGQHVLLTEQAEAQEEGRECRAFVQR